MHPPGNNLPCTEQMNTRPKRMCYWCDFWGKLPLVLADYSTNSACLHSHNPCRWHSDQYHNYIYIRHRTCRHPYLAPSRRNKITITGIDLLQKIHIREKSHVFLCTRILWTLKNQNWITWDHPKREIHSTIFQHSTKQTDLSYNKFWTG